MCALLSSGWWACLIIALMVPSDANEFVHVSSSTPLDLQHPDVLEVAEALHTLAVNGTDESCFSLPMLADAVEKAAWTQPGTEGDAKPRRAVILTNCDAHCLEVRVQLEPVCAINQ